MKNKKVKIFIMLMLLIFTLGGIKAKAYEGMPSGYRPLATTDQGKIFGNNLESTIYFDMLAPATDRDYMLFNNGRGIFDQADTGNYVYGIDKGGEQYDIITLTIYNEYLDEIYATSLGEVIGRIVSVQISGNNTIYVKDRVEVLDYTLTYNTNGGNSIAQATHITEIPSLPTPTKTDHIFKGWYYDNNSFKYGVMKGDEMTQNMTIYAKWSSTTEEAYNQGYQDGLKDAEQMGSGEVSAWFISTVLASFALLNFEIFPGIQLGYLLFIPLMFGLFFWFLKMIRGDK